jgi:hypothetical protein
VFEWPLREIMLAYVESMKVSARRNYELELTVWASLAPHQRRKTNPPSVPRVLRS